MDDIYFKSLYTVLSIPDLPTIVEMQIKAKWLRILEKSSHWQRRLTIYILNPSLLFKISSNLPMPY